MPVIECQELTKDYLAGFWRRRPRRALDRLTLSVEAGEIFGFLGPNGAGKTTTLKLLMGLIRPTAGAARLLGAPPGERLARIGYLPENPYFYDYLSCRELLEYYGRLSGLRGADLARSVASALERVEMHEHAGLALRKCSKGMLQRIGLAQAILHDPELLILDEPMSGLDPLGRGLVRELMLELKRRGRTIFFSTHILSDAEQLCDRVAVLDRGRLRRLGPLEELTAAEPGADDELEVRWRSPRPFAVPLTGVEPLPDGSSRALVARPQLWDLLAALHLAGAELLALEPRRRGLDQLFTGRPGKEVAP